jgi:Transposase DDE domain group 1
MPTECNTDRFAFAPVESHKVVAGFDGGAITSDAGALLLGQTDRALRLVERFAGCFVDCRRPELTEHLLATLVGQRVYGLALGYEDLNDHDHLRHDPLFGVLAGKLTGRRKDCAAVAGKSTLNRLERSTPEPTRYHKISYDSSAIEALFVDLFLDAHKVAPAEIILDLDATDDPLHGAQEGRFFHGYYDSYCYLPLYIFCGRHLLAARLRRANIDGSAGAVEEVARLTSRIRARWPKVHIVLRADSGFARDELMSWCEANDVDYLFGLAKNTRLIEAIGAELAEAAWECLLTGKPARRFKDFTYRTRQSWSRERRVIGKAEWMRPSPAEIEDGTAVPRKKKKKKKRTEKAMHDAAGNGQAPDGQADPLPPEGRPNPRFIVTSLTAAAYEGRTLYEKRYCARGEMENRIKECQLDLFADRTSSHTMRANQLRLWFAAMAYVLVDGLRRVALAGTCLADATCGTIRLKLLKIGALVRVSVRRVKFSMASAFPYTDVFRTAWAALDRAAR